MDHKRILSFKYAFEGIKDAFVEEPNLKVHFIVAFLVLLLGIFLKISRQDWLFLVITTGVVISVELTNTAIEWVVDSFVDKEHPGAKKAKDISAGAVLIVSIMAIFVGVLVFIPYIS